MSAINIDSLTFASTLDSSFSDNSLANAANLPPAFGDYLQQAQAQPTGQSAASPSSLSNSTSNTDLNDPPASPPPSSSSFAPQADTSAANQSSSSPADRWLQTSSHNTSPAESNSTPINSSQANASSTPSSNETASTNSQSNSGIPEQDHGRGPSHQVQAPAAGTVQEGSSKKASAPGSAGPTATTVATLAAANAAQIAHGNLSAAVPPASPPAHTGTSAGTTPAPANAKTPQTVSAPPAGASRQANGTQTNAALVNGSQTAVPPLPVPQNSPADVAAPAATGNPASGPGATAIAASATSPSAVAINSTGQDTATSLPADASAVAAAPVIPSATTPAAPGGTKPAAANTPLAAVTGVAGVTSAGQTVISDNALSGSAGIDTALGTDVSSAREQRAVPAIDAISATASGDSSSAAAAKPSAANSASTIAPPQAPAPGTTTANSGTSTATADTDLSQADRARFVQRVEQAFQDLSEQGGSVRLRLSPPELGSLRIEISVAKGVLTARVEAETPSARNLLLDNLPALRERLAQQDIKVQRFDVDLMDRSGSGAFNQSSNYQNPSQQNAARTAAPVIARGGDSLASVEATPSRPVSSSGRLNVIV